MARYYDITVDGNGGVLVVEGGAVVTLESTAAMALLDAQLIASGSSAVLAMRDSALLEIGQTGFSSAYLTISEDSVLRLRDESSLIFQTGSKMKGTVNLDTGLTISGGNLSISGDLAIESGADLDIKGGAEIHIEIDGKIIVEPAGQVTLNPGASLDFNSASWIQGTPLLGDGDSNSGILYVLANGEIRLYDTGGKLTVESASHGDGIVLTGGATATLDVNATGQLNLYGGMNVKSTGVLTLETNSTFVVNTDVTFDLNKAINYTGAGRYLTYDSVVMYPVWFQNSSDPGTNWQFTYGSDGGGNDRCYWSPILLTEDAWDAIFYIQIPVSAVELSSVELNYYGGTWSNTPAASLGMEVVITQSGAPGQQYSAIVYETATAGDHGGYQVLIHSMGGGQAVQPGLYTVCVRIYPPEKSTGESGTPEFRLLSLRCGWRLGKNEPG
jgi:hypothetical protein